MTTFRTHSLTCQRVMLVLLSLTLFACGGQSSTSVKNNDGDNNAASTAEQPTLSNIKALLSKAPITQATCNIYDIINAQRSAEPLATATSQQGLIDFGQVNHRRMVAIECLAGSYIDEMSLSRLAAPRLRAVVDSTQTDLAVITPLTEITYRMAERDGDLELAHTVYAPLVAKAFGLADIYINSTPPSDSNNEHLSHNESGQYGAIMAAFSAMQQLGDMGRSMDIILSEFSTEDVQLSLRNNNDLPENKKRFFIRALNYAGTHSNTLPKTITDAIIAPLIKAPTLRSIDAVNAPLFQPIDSVEIQPDNGVYINACSASPSLPKGLIIAMDDVMQLCRISGTPTTATNGQLHSIRLSNPAGSVEQSLSLTLHDQPLIESDKTLWLLRANTNEINWHPISKGYPISHYSISPQLPSGLKLNQLNGHITGTATVATARNNYALTGTTDNGESATLNLSITVLSQAPSITTSNSSPIIATQGQAISPWKVDNQGGTVQLYSINPKLPNGLNFDTGTGEISGTPSELSELQSYTINATNRGGTSTVTVPLAVNALSPQLSSDITALNFTQYLTINQWKPNNSGGEATQYSISPSLPSGLAINAVTGIIYGSPTAPSAEKTYVISAENSGGTSQLRINITVKIAPPKLSSSASNILNLRENISQVNWEVSNTGGTVSTYSISPALPKGLTLDSTSGRISGTPNEVITSTEYTISASNNGGSDSVKITLSVAGEPPQFNNSRNTVIGDDSTVRLLRGVEIQPYYINNIGGSIKDIRVSPTLPSGLSYDAEQGQITGTPTQISAATQYTITASNEYGSTEVIITLEIYVPLADLSSSTPSSLNLFIDSTEVDWTINNTGGEVTEYRIHPTLPAGLNFDQTTGRITGVATETSPATEYVISAVNDGGSVNFTLTISVQGVAPIISAPSDSIDEEGHINMVLKFDRPMNNWQLNNAGGPISNHSITPDLPTGLSFDPSSISFSGTPSAITQNTLYTLTTNNAYGSSSIQFSLIVVADRPTLSITDPYLDDQWFIENNGQAPSSWGRFQSLKAGADLRIKPVWDMGYYGEGVNIVVVDNGVAFQHSDLDDQALQSNGESPHYDFVDLDNDPRPDGNEHGTSVAGLIAAEANQVGTVGIAPKAKLIGYRYVVSNPSDYRFAYDVMLENKEALNTQVSNHSYGNVGSGIIHVMSTYEYDRIVAAVTSLHPKGHVMVFSSGNGRDNSLAVRDASELINYASGQYFTAINYGDYAGYSARLMHPYIFAISGFDANDNEVSYAEAGPSILVAGATGNRFPSSTLKPGDFAYTVTKIENTQSPSAALATLGLPSQDYNAETSHRSGGDSYDAGYTMSFNGTSASAPTVTGIVALMQSANPELTWRDIRWLLAKTARKIQGGGPGETSGMPIDTSWSTTPEQLSEQEPFWSNTGNDTFGRYSHFFGFGAANAKAAVTEALHFDNLPEMFSCTLSNADLSDNIHWENNENCPDTIEFVQVDYSIAENTNYNELTLNMEMIQATQIIDKPIKLLRRTSRDETHLTSSELRMNYSGTIGFMGDSFAQNDGFKFSTNNAKGVGDVNNGAVLSINAIKVFGFNQASQ